jgi:tetratricopeptide (TPR) repeat protein
LTGERKTVDAELAATVRREASLKKAVDVQARKAFEAEKAAREAREQLLEARKKQANAEADAKKATAELSSGRVAGGGQSGKSGVDKGKTVDMTGPSVVKLLTSGRKFLMEKKVQEAEDVYLQALKLDPQNPQVTYNLGVLYGDYMDNPRKAASYYRQYLKYAPRAPDAAAVRGWIMELEARSR